MATRDEYEGIITYHQGRQCFRTMSQEHREKVLGGFALFKFIDSKPEKTDVDTSLMFNLFKRAHIILFYLNKGLRNVDIKELDELITTLKKAQGYE